MIVITFQLSFLCLSLCIICLPLLSNGSFKSQFMKEIMLLWFHKVQILKFVFYHSSLWWIIFIPRHWFQFKKNVNKSQFNNLLAYKSLENYYQTALSYLHYFKLQSKQKNTKYPKCNLICNVISLFSVCLLFLSKYERSYPITPENNKSNTKKYDENIITKINSISCIYCRLIYS